MRIWQHWCRLNAFFWLLCACTTPTADPNACAGPKTIDCCCGGDFYFEPICTAGQWHCEIGKAHSGTECQTAGLCTFQSYRYDIDMPDGADSSEVIQSADATPSADVN